MSILILSGSLVLLGMAAAFFSKKLQLNGVWAFGAFALLGVCAGLLLFAGKGSTLYYQTPEAPDSTVTAFFDAVCEHRYKAAGRYLSNYSDLSFNKNLDYPQVSRELYASYSYRFLGSEMTGENTAGATVEFTVLDLGKVQTVLKEELYVVLAEIVDSRSTSEVYDENNDYRESILEEAYQTALEQVLNHAADYYTTVSLTVPLEYSNKQWQVRAEQDLLNAICGCIGN